LFFVDGEAAISVASTSAPAQQRTAGFQMLGYGRENRLRQVVGLEQVAEVQDRRLVGNGIAAELQAGERAHRLHVVERLLRARIGQIVPLLKAIDAKHHRQRKRPPPAFRAHLRVARLNHRFKRPPRHHHRHLGQEHITLRALLLRRKVERRKAQLVHGSPLESPRRLCHGSKSCSEVP
jgi:hypothetical protein